jgi:hypothetical protein
MANPEPESSKHPSFHGSRWYRKHPEVQRPAASVTTKVPREMGDAVHLGKKELILFVAAQVLALAAIAVFDPILFACCFAAAWVLCVVLCILHSGPRWNRFWAGLVVTVLMAGVGFRIFEKLRGTVEVSPVHISFKKSGDTYYVYLRNTRDERVYSIVLLVRSVEASVNPRDVTMTVPPQSKKPLMGTLPIADVVRAVCHDKKTDQLVWQLTIDNMEPKEIRSVILNATRPVDMTAVVYSYQTDQRPVRWMVDGVNNTLVTRGGDGPKLECYAVFKDMVGE